MQRAAKHILLMAAVLALAASAGAADLFNNTNGGGVLNRAPNPAFLTLGAPARVTQSVWAIYLLDSTGKAWGEIGQVDIDCRAYGR